MATEGEAALRETGCGPMDIGKATLADRIVLISLIAGAFARRRTSRRTRPAWWMVYAVLGAVDLTIKEAICDRDRRAVLCWSPTGSRRETVAGLVLGVAIAVIVAVAAVLSGAERVVARAGWATVMALVAVLILALLAMVRAWGPRRSVAARRPAGCWCVSSLASIVPGTGRALLVELCRRADEAGHDLCLNATVGPLTDCYYPQFGFESSGPSLRTKRTRQLQPMVRHPSVKGTAAGPGTSRFGPTLD